jgi:hypothetical protein
MRPKAATTASSQAATDYYYNESWQVLEERTDGDAATVQWLWDARYIDAPVLRWRDADGDAQTGENGLEETVCFCQDANMNVTAAVTGNRRQPDREAGGREISIVSPDPPDPTSPDPTYTRCVMSLRQRWLLVAGILGLLLGLGALGIEVHRCPGGRWVINWFSLFHPHDCPFEEAEAHLRMVSLAQEHFRDVTGRYAVSSEELISRGFADKRVTHARRVTIRMSSTPAGWYAVAHGLPGGRVLLIDEAGTVREERPTPDRAAD